MLGLERGATVKEIRKAYKRQALRFHPDRVTRLSEDKRKKGEARFVRVQEAHEVLTDDSKRR